jgi:hypothetical protein
MRSTDPGGYIIYRTTEQLVVQSNKSLSRFPSLDSQSPHPFCCSVAIVVNVAGFLQVFAPLRLVQGRSSRNRPQYRVVQRLCLRRMGSVSAVLCMHGSAVSELTSLQVRRVGDNPPSSLESARPTDTARGPPCCSRPLTRSSSVAAESCNWQSNQLWPNLDELLTVLPELKQRLDPYTGDPWPAQAGAGDGGVVAASSQSQARQVSKAPASSKAKVDASAGGGGGSNLPKRWQVHAAALHVDEGAGLRV